MKKFFHIAKTVILKAIAFILLSLLAIFNSVLKLFTVVFRFVAIPTVLFGMLITVVTLFDNGYSTSLLRATGIFVAITALYFLLPYVPEVLGRTQVRMQGYVFSPIMVRSPVKFTL